MEKTINKDSLLYDKNKNNFMNRDILNIRIKNIKLRANQAIKDSSIIKSKINIPKLIGHSNNNKINKLSKTFQLENNSSNKDNKLCFERYSPEKKRVKSGILISPKEKENNLLYKMIAEKQKEENISVNNNKKIKNCNAYYYSGSLHIKNKYIVDAMPHYKSLSSYYFIKNNNINNTYRKIDYLAKSLYLFQREKKLYQNNSNSEIFVELNKKKHLNNNSNRSLIQFHKSSIIGETFNTRESGKIYNKNISSQKRNDTNNIMRLKVKNITNRYNKNINDNIFNNNKNNDDDSEYLYKKIFYYNLEKRKRKALNYIDNKLNIIYSENEIQYCKKMNKINQYFLKEGKPIKHRHKSEITRLYTSEIINKIHFMKKIVDYVYPKMVLDKVKKENRRIFKAKSMEFKMSYSKLMLLKIKQKQKKINNFIGKSINLIK